MEFTRRDTNIGKGIAICLMIIHHLFNSKARILEGNYYIPMLYFADIEIHIARFGKICVASFLFLSGYGLFLGFQKSKKNIAAYVFKKLTTFYGVFWAQFIVFVPIGFLFFSYVTVINLDILRYVVDWQVIILSFLGMSNRFNGAWWFATVYIQLLILVFPVYFYLINKNIKIFLIVNLVLFLLNMVYAVPVKLLLWQTSFAFGMLIAKYNFFSSPYVKKIDSLHWGIILAAVPLLFFLRMAIGPMYDFLLAPVFLYSAIRLIKLLKMSNVFEYLGTYSFPMWLNHNFIALYYFQDIMFYPRYSPLIVIFVVVSSLAASVVIEKTRCGLVDILQGNKNKLVKSR